MVSETETCFKNFNKYSKIKLMLITLNDINKFLAVDLKLKAILSLYLLNWAKYTDWLLIAWGQLQENDQFHWEPLTLNLFNYIYHF